MDKLKFKLEPITEQNYEDLIRMMLKKQPGEVPEYLVAFNRFPSLCKITTVCGAIRGVLYPDPNSGSIIKIHCCFLGGEKTGKAQVPALKQYVADIFNRGFIKVEIEVVETNRLVIKLAESLGFKREGTRRLGHLGIYVVYYYGLLKEEYDGQRW